MHDEPRSTSIGWLLVALPATKLILHLVTIPGYGWFRDELYYLACADHLAFGYVDQPPLSIFLLWLVRLLLGDSLWAVRVVPAVAGALLVYLTGRMAALLGGGRFAQALAMVAAIAAPVYLSLHHIYSMNALDGLFWASAAWLLIRLLKEQRPRLWLYLGVVLGLGLENKISVLWLGLGIFVGLLLTSRRRDLLTPWPWIGGAVAMVLFLPHLIWQVAHDWPTLEFMRNATQEKMAAVAPLDFIASQIQMMNPVTAPIWLAGLVWLLVLAEGRRFRLLGWTWVVVFFLLAASGTARAFYLAAAYPWLFAAGGRAFERLSERRGLGWVREASLVAVVAVGAVAAPLGLPLLPVPTYVAYARALGQTPDTAERKELAELPQFYADMHGWEEMAAAVADVYHQLSPAEREQAVVFGRNYGQAGAIDRLGRRHGLPPAISGHNSYWLWGPGERSGEVVIVIGGREESLREVFSQVEPATTIECGYCMPYENHQPVWIARGLERPLDELWPELRHYQ